MSFLRNLKQNISNLQSLFRKKKNNQASTSNGNNSENYPVKVTPSKSPGSSGSPKADRHCASGCVQGSVQDMNVDDLSTQNRKTKIEASPGTQRDGQGAGANSSEHQNPAASTDSRLSVTSDDRCSDSGGEDKGVSRCQCSSRNPGFDSSVRSSRRSSPHASASSEFVYSLLTDVVEAGATLDGDENFPSTSNQRSSSNARRTVGVGGGSPGGSNLDKQMEEMVNRLQSRGSLRGRGRRSRSRSRRSQTRQSCESSVASALMNSVRVVQTFPVRETDSDDSNTESHHSRPPSPFLYSGGLQKSPSAASNRSNQSFHSLTESDGCLTPRTSCTEYRGEEVGGSGRGLAGAAVGGEWVELNAPSPSDRTGHEENGADLMQIQDLSGYGPEEFVLDLLLAMCRGTWSDIL